MGTPAPFLSKLYELVSDTFTDDLISWEKSGQSFVVHKPTEFSLVVLPHYFKHNNFSSFIRQLNQYGFHKLHPDEWIFGHHYFKWGQKDKLINIIRKKKKYLKVDGFNFENRDNYKKKLETEVDLLKRYRYELAKDVLDVCRRQEKFLLNQKYLESVQKKLETEVNHLKSFIFGYFSRVISSEREFDMHSKYFYTNKHLTAVPPNKVTIMNNSVPRLNILDNKNI
nr:heat shock transcription factor [Cryptomonas sp.]